MKNTAIIMFVYALLILIGGWMGYAKAGSSASLISGIGFSLALSFCSLWIAQGKALAFYIALVLIFLLDTFFTFRFAKTHQFLPAGLMSLLSLGMLIFIALKVKKNFKKS